MIAVSIFLAGAVLLVVPGLLDQPRCLPGREWARAVAPSLAGGLVAVVVGLLLFALPTLLAALHSAGVTGICEGVPVPLAPGGPVLGWAALAAAVLVTIRAVRGGRSALRAARSAAVEPWLGRHEHHGEFDLVVIPTDALLAMSVPSTPPQVVISAGLVECLDPDQLDVVIQHEATHHRCGHWRYSLVAAVVESGLRPVPFVDRSARTLRASLERWADEGVAGTSAARRTHISRALAAVGGAHRWPGTRWQAQIGARRERLARPSGTTSAVSASAVAPALLLAPTALLTLAAWNIFAHHMAAVAGSCPH
jgi:Zn-dependent protease with chaperone function